MSIHHCLSLKLPDVVADIKINAVLQPFTANQLEAQNTQNGRGQFIDQARQITAIFIPNIYIWRFHDIVQSYQYVCYHVEQWKSGRKCAILFQQIGNISSEEGNWNTLQKYFVRNWRMTHKWYWYTREELNIFDNQLSVCLLSCLAAKQWDCHFVEQILNIFLKKGIGILFRKILLDTLNDIQLVLIHWQKKIC